MDRAVLGADHAPAALGLDAAQRRQHARTEPPEPGAVGDLIEPVFRRDRADLHRLEQDVVAWITRHGA